MREPTSRTILAQPHGVEHARRSRSTLPLRSWIQKAGRYGTLSYCGRGDLTVREPALVAVPARPCLKEELLPRAKSLDRHHHHPYYRNHS